MTDVPPRRKPVTSDADLDARLRAAYARAAEEPLTPELRALLDRLREAEARGKLGRKSGGGGQAEG